MPFNKLDLLSAPLLAFFVCMLKNEETRVYIVMTFSDNRQLTKKKTMIDVATIRKLTITTINIYYLAPSFGEF